MTTSVRQLSENEMGYLNDKLNSGDRAGYYLSYFNMTGSDQSLEQAQISVKAHETNKRQKRVFLTAAAEKLRAKISQELTK